MESGHLEYFVRIVDAGSITKATSVYVNPPSMRATCPDTSWSTAASLRLYNCSNRPPAGATMREVSTDQTQEIDSAEIKGAMFEGALRILAARIGVTEVNIAGTPISRFKESYTAVLNRVRAGSIEVVTQRREPFVILGANQVLALVESLNRRRTASELLEGLPSLPASSDPPPRHRSIGGKSHHRVPRSSDERD
jgi:hypothetical protein